MNTPRYWYCIIGPVDDSKIPDGGDFQPRIAARDAVFQMTGEDPRCSSGWLSEEAVEAMRKAEISVYTKNSQ